MSVSAFAADYALPPAQEARYQTLLSELRCLVCQNETLADSNAPLAADLRQQVRVMIEHGDSDSDIRRYLTNRYGDFVLYKPPFKATTWLLWVGPFVLLALGLIVVSLIFRRSPQPKIDAKTDEEAVHRILGDRKP